MIDINDITVRMGSHVLLSHASAHISDRQKVGLVGLNGCGKSTLFRVLLGEIGTETGTISFPARTKIAYMEQELSDLSLSLLDYVLEKDTERMVLLKRLETADAEELADIHERLTMIDADGAPARAAHILTGLGFQEKDIYRPLSEFSGGWRMRVALAGTLFAPSDYLLLDEPTNHLDLEAVLWFVSHLQKYRGTLLLISHDRTVLNALCTQILHLEHQTLSLYSGNYDTFVQTRTQKQELLQKLAAKQEQKRQHLQSFVDRFRYKATKAKQAQSRLKMLAKMETIPLLTDEGGARFDFPQPVHLAPPLITLEKAAVGYNGKAVLKNLTLQIDSDDRIALLGANGNGKSTLAKLLAGRLKPLEGSISHSKKISVGYFAQHQAEELPLEKTALGFMSGLMNDATETKVRSHLARFGLEGEKALTLIKRLSGGEKARLLFAAMSREAPALFILDEPTNHLDMDARDALIEALNAYEGAVLLITHDLHLIELIADKLWLVQNQTCRPFDGDLEDYKKLLLEDPAMTAKDKKENVSAKTERRIQAQKRAVLAPLKKEMQRLEQTMEALNQQKEQIENRFMEPLTPGEITNLQKELAQLDKQIASLEEKWLKLGDELEKS